MTEEYSCNECKGIFQSSDELSEHASRCNSSPLSNQSRFSIAMDMFSKRNSIPCKACLTAQSQLDSVESTLEELNEVLEKKSAELDKITKAFQQAKGVKSQETEKLSNLSAKVHEVEKNLHQSVEALKELKYNDMIKLSKLKEDSVAIKTKFEKLKTFTEELKSIYEKSKIEEDERKKRESSTNQSNFIQFQNQNLESSLNYTMCMKECLDRIQLKCTNFNRDYECLQELIQLVQNIKDVVATEFHTDNLNTKNSKKEFNSIVKNCRSLTEKEKKLKEQNSLLESENLEIRTRLTSLNQYKHLFEETDRQKNTLITRIENEVFKLDEMKAKHEQLRISLEKLSNESTSNNEILTNKLEAESKAYQDATQKYKELKSQLQSNKDEYSQICQQLDELKIKKANDIYFYENQILNLKASGLEVEEKLVILKDINFDEKKNLISKYEKELSEINHKINNINQENDSISSIVEDLADRNLELMANYRTFSHQYNNNKCRYEQLSTELGFEVERNQFLQLEISNLKSIYRQNKELTTECTGCRKKFSIIGSKHNCKICGMVFCSGCINQSVSSSLHINRVCRDCASRE